MKQLRLIALLLVASCVLGALDDTGCDTEKGCWKDGGGTVIVTWRRQNDLVKIQMGRALSGSSPQYLALGFSTDKRMGEDYVVWCRTSEGAVGHGINPGGRDQTTVVTENFLTGSAVKWSYADGMLMCEFDLPLALPAPAVIAGGPTSLDEQLYLLQAWGSYNGRPSYHANKMVTGEMVKVSSEEFASLATEQGMSIQEKNNLKRAHGAVMTLAWVVLSSISILMPRFYKSYLTKDVMGKPIWFRVHQVGNGLAVMFNIIGLLLILGAEGWDWEGPRAGQTGPIDKGQEHSIIGIITIIIAFLQPLNALLRCAPTSRYRPIFNWPHRFFGLCGWVLAMASLLIAADFRHLRGPPGNEVWGEGAKICFGVFIAVYLLCWILLQVHWWFTEYRRPGRTSDINLDKNPPPIPDPDEKPRVLLWRRNLWWKKVELKMLWVRGLLLAVVVCLALAVWIAIVIMLARNGLE